MFDFAFSEMLLAALVALVVLGPERLPQAARAAGGLGGAVGGARRASRSAAVLIEGLHLMRVPSRS